MRRRSFLEGAAVATVCASLPGAAWALVYPERGVRIVVGFPADGPVDIAARLIGTWLSGRLGQPFTVENKPGDSGNGATRAVARAAPDGYTLLACGPVNTINTTLFPGLDVNFSTDVAAVASLYRVPLVIEVNPSLPIDSPDGFLAFARANPGKLKIAYAGNGTPQHIGIELFKSMAGVDLALVPYQGSAPALADLVAGRVDAMFDPMPSSISLIRAGKLRPIAVTTQDRSPALPDVPAMSSVVPGYEAGSWFGLAAPKGTPAQIIDRLNGAVNEGLADPGVASRITDLGGTLMAMSPGAFAAFIATETARHARVIEAAGIKLQ